MKIAICTPHYSGVHAKFTLSLMGMIAHTSHASIIYNGAPIAPSLEVFMSSGSVLSKLRNTLVRDAFDWGANYLLWLDSDHVFPPDILVRLLARNLPVVGANYPRRDTPTYPTALYPDGSVAWTTQQLAEAGSVEQVARLGLGVCLMDMNVIPALEQAALSAGRESIWPLFCQEPIVGALEVTGEDTYFFNLLTLAGIPAYVDHSVSWDVGHIHEVILYNKDAVAQKDAYLASRR